MPPNHSVQTRVPMIGFVARSGTGKTQLLKQLIPLLRTAGLRIAVIKSTHHDVDIDTPGKDSYELRKAGASQTLLAARQRTLLVIEHELPRDDVRLQDCIASLDQSTVDLILVEGFKHEAYPKIELQRSGLNHPALCTDDPHIIAVASDNPTPAQYPVPMLDMNNPQQICDFILQITNLQTINHHD